MAWTLHDLLQGTTPTFDAQALRDETDDLIFAAGHQGYGIVAGALPVVSNLASTAVLTAAAITLSSIVNSTVPTTAALGFSWPLAGGYFSCPTTGGGTAVISYTAISGNNFTGCNYISGGSGSIAASSTLSSQFALAAAAVTAGIYNQYTAVNFPAFDLSLQAPGGGFAALPCSTGGDRKDIIALTTAGVASIVQGTACSQVDWTRNNGGYANPSPVKPPWSSSSPIILTEIYVPGAGSTHGNISISAGNLVDKSLILVKA